jgi:two-component system OmpR family response regulator
MAEEEFEAKLNDGGASAGSLETSATVLLVDDDERLLDLTKAFLEKHGLVVFTAQDASRLDQVLTRVKVDIVVLDLMLPGENGLSICRRLAARQGRPGIIMLSAAGEDMDRIIGLEVGADDYLGKPCNPRELLARVRALLRRTERRYEAKAEHQLPELVYKFAGWTASAWTGRLKAPDGTTIALTGQEFALLQIFLDNPRQILSRDTLLHLMRGKHTHAFERIIDAQISRLRKKLNTFSLDTSELIRTIRNEGYMFVGTVNTE